MISYAYTILYVENIEKSMKFYETVFGFTRKLFIEDYGELNTGITLLAFTTHAHIRKSFTDYEPISREKNTFGIELGFTTDDVRATYQNALENGAIGLLGPTEKPWGQVISYIRDIDGFLVEICGQMG